MIDLRDLEIGSKWRHYKGTLYAIVCCCRYENTEEPCVVYVQVNPDEPDALLGQYWCRPISQWEEEVQPGVKRFTKQQGGKGGDVAGEQASSG